MLAQVIQNIGVSGVLDTYMFFVSWKVGEWVEINCNGNVPLITVNNGNGKRYFFENLKVTVTGNVTF